MTPWRPYVAAALSLVRTFLAGIPPEDRPMTDVISQPAPADSLATIRALRPTMPHVPRSIVEAVVSQGGSIGSTTTVARRYGLPNRFRLARMLKRAGLPPLHRLAEWVLVESWLRRSEREGVSLCHMAFHSDRYPSTCYRLVKELTGLKWGELRARGLRWYQNEFARQLQSAALARAEHTIGGGSNL